jgi:RND family efflux transporter MFP subunit
VEVSNLVQKLKRRVFQVAKLLAVLAVVGGAVYWMKFSPVPASGHRIELGEIVAEVMGTGTLEARVKSAVSPKIAGRIETLLVDEGDRVEAGQLLFSLDDADLRQQVEIAEANVASSLAAITRLETDQSRAQAVLEQAKRSHDRIQQLVVRNVTTAEDGDKATESLRIAQAGMARAEAALVEGHKEQITAEKNLAHRRALLKDTHVVAPFDGLIVRRMRDPGDIVVPGSPTLTLVSLDEIWVSAWVDETEMARLRVGQPARVAFRSEPRQSYEGQVARLGREADRETREFIVDVRVLKLPENWAVGQRAEVYIETARKSSVPVLPTRYVVWRDAAAGVYCQVGDEARWRAVKLGLQSREAAEVLEGLAPGDVVLMASGGKNVDLEGRRLALP